MNNKSVIIPKNGRCIGILYSPKEVSVKLSGGRSAKLSISDYRRTDKGSLDYEICLERELVGHQVVIESTGVTLKMLKKFSKGKELTDEERKAIVKFLTSGGEQKSTHFSEKQLRIAARIFLEMGDATILEVKNLRQVLDELAKYEDLWGRGGLLEKEELKRILNWTSLSGEGPAPLLRALGEYPILCKGKDALVRNEMFKEILKSDTAERVLIELGRNPRIWKSWSFNMVSLAMVLSSKDPVGEIKAWVISGRLKGIPDLPVYELLRCIVTTVIGSDGRIDRAAVNEVRKLVCIKDTRHSAHVHRILGLLEKDDGFRKLIKRVKAPGDVEGTGTVKSYIRMMLQLPESEELTKLDARRAVLGAVLSDLRQENVGSCYGTAIAICVHDSIPHLMVGDLASMVEKGYFVRKRNTEQGEVEERFYIGENFAVEVELGEWQLPRDSFSWRMDKLSFAYPEFKEIFLKIRDIARKESSESIIDVLSIFHKMLMDHFGITEDDLRKEKELRDLANQINILTVEASLNDDQQLDKEAQKLIEKYEKKAGKLDKKKFEIESYHKAQLELYRILYVEKHGISLLTKGWEYAIMSSELRGIEREHEISSYEVPPMMRELLKDALFNSDKGGGIFMDEWLDVQDTLTTIDSAFDEQQRRQLFGCLLKIMNTVESIVDKRITVSTYGVAGTDDTGHQLICAMGEKDVKKFKVLAHEQEYSEAVVGCMMEAFDEVIRNEAKMDKAVRDYLMSFRGMFGDQLKSKAFRSSIQSFLAYAQHQRSGNVANVEAYDFLRRSWRVSTVYFEKAYMRNLLWVERPDSLMEEFFESIGCPMNKRMSEIDREVDLIKSSNKWRKFIESHRKGVTMSYSVLLSSLIVLGLYLIATGFSLIVGGVTIGLVLWLFRKTRSTVIRHVTSRTDNKEIANILVHFIEAGRFMYKNVKNHDEWIKYPMEMADHVCTLMPFNESIRDIVDSDEDIRHYVKRKMASPHKMTIAVMDSNWNKCYLGFELGEGSIRTVLLNPKLEVISDHPVEDFKDIQVAESVYKTIDKRISKYKKGA